MSGFGGGFGELGETLLTVLVLTAGGKVVDEAFDKPFAAAWAKLDEVDKRDEAFKDRSGNLMLHLAGTLLGQLLIDCEHLDKELLEGLVPFDYITSDQRALGGQGDDVVGRVVDQLALGQGA